MQGNDEGTAPREADQRGGEQEGQGRGGGELRQTLRDELSEVVREAAREVLVPAARDATTNATRYAVTRAPELLKEAVGSRLRGAGGPLAFARGLASRAGGVRQKLSKAGERDGGGDGGGEGGEKGEGGETPTGTGRGRRLPLQESIDVGVPVEIAYDQWTQFEEFPRFLRGVERVEQRDDTTLVWNEKLWGVRRSWVAEITDQRPDERIAWHSTSGPQQVGVVSFHPLADRLTRILVTLDHQPSGFFERVASGMRYTHRALESDLKRFKALVEMAEEPSGAWRGRIEEGEVTDGERQPAGEGEDTGPDQQAGREQEPEEAGEEEPEEEAGEEEPEEEPEEKPREVAEEKPEEPEEQEPEEEPREVAEESSLDRRRRRAREREEEERKREQARQEREQARRARRRPAPDRGR
jgi:uncharacterized membrane protein